jgi:hypothetical protein
MLPGERGDGKRLLAKPVLRCAMDDAVDWAVRLPVAKAWPWCFMA